MPDDDLWTSSPFFPPVDLTDHGRGYPVTAVAVAVASAADSGRAARDLSVAVAFVERTFPGRRKRYVYKSIDAHRHLQIFNIVF